MVSGDPGEVTGEDGRSARNYPGPYCQSLQEEKKTGAHTAYYTLFFIRCWEVNILINTSNRGKKKSTFSINILFIVFS